MEEVKEGLMGVKLSSSFECEADASLCGGCVVRIDACPSSGLCCCRLAGSAVAGWRGLWSSMEELCIAGGP